MQKPIKTFRGKLTDGGIDKIYITGGDSDTGFKISKFELMGATPGAADFESVVKIYKTRQTTATADVNFSDPSLLAAGTYQANSAAFNYPTSLFVIADLEVFNQDIYITHQDLQGNEVNYYIELEAVKMSGPEQAVVNFSAAILNRN